MEYNVWKETVSKGTKAAEKTLAIHMWLKHWDFQCGLAGRRSIVPEPKARESAIGVTPEALTSGSLSAL